MAKFKNSASSQLATVAKLHRMQASILLARIGLYPGQEKILKTLSKKRAYGMGALAERLEVRPPTVTKMVNRLAAQHLVQRTKNGDGRGMLVRLTKLGAERAKEISRLWRKLDKKTLKGFRRKDQRRLRKVLKKMAKNLGRIKQPIQHDNDDDVNALEASA